MKIRITALVGSVAGLLLAVAAMVYGAHVQAATVTNQSLAVPLFAKPGSNTFWDDVRAAGSQSVPFVIANVNNGPGAKIDAAYATAITKNDTEKIRTLGYVQTNNQVRPFRDAYNDVDNWHKFYPQTSGIYIDLLKEGGQEEACYVAALYNHIKNVRPNDLVILGAGGHMSSTYEPYGDIFVNAASDYVTYQAWRVQYRGFEDRIQYQNRFMHLVYSVPSEQYSTAFSTIRNNNAGWMFMTDKTIPSPYGATPTFWQNEASDIGTLPASVIPNRGKTTLPRGCISLSSSADSSVDTRTAKRAVTSSTVTVNNTSATYVSEPTTKLTLMSLPKGIESAGFTNMQGWTCDTTTRSCTYGLPIAAVTSPPTIETILTAGCDYAGGDALLRLTNFAGNQWDLRMPVRAPFGCPEGSPAARLNTDSSGTLASITTQSNETTPEIVPLGGNATSDDSQKAAPAQKKGSFLKTVAWSIIAIIILSLVGWGLWLQRKRSRYSVKL